MQELKEGDAALQAIRRIETWGKQAGLSLPRTFAVDLGEAYRSAKVLVESVDILVTEGVGTREKAQALVSLQAWTYGDLVDHVERLKRPLEQVIKQLYDQLPGADTQS
jgi:hypothetical protein